jgi:hypothetical protein
MRVNAPPGVKKRMRNLPSDLQRKMAANDGDPEIKTDIRRGFRAWKEALQRS